MNYPMPHFSVADLDLDRLTCTTAEGALARLLHVISYEARTGRSYVGDGILERLMSPDVKCLFTAFPARGAAIWNLIQAGAVHLEYRASPVGYHDGAWGIARLMARPQTGTVFLTPASLYRRVRAVHRPPRDVPFSQVVEGNRVEYEFQSPHQSLEQCLLHELAHLAGARETEAVEIGNSTPSFTDLKLEAYDATWLGVVEEP